MAWVDALNDATVDRYWDLSETTGDFLAVVGKDDFTVKSGTLSTATGVTSIGTGTS